MGSPGLRSARGQGASGGSIFEKMKPKGQSYIVICQTKDAPGVTRGILRLIVGGVSRAYEHRRHRTTVW